MTPGTIIADYLESRVWSAYANDEGFSLEIDAIVSESIREGMSPLLRRKLMDPSKYTSLYYSLTNMLHNHFNASQIPTDGRMVWEKSAEEYIEMQRRITDAVQRPPAIVREQLAGEYHFMAAYGIKVDAVKKALSELGVVEENISSAVNRVFNDAESYVSWQTKYHDARCTFITALAASIVLVEFVGKADIEIEGIANGVGKWLAELYKRTFISKEARAMGLE